MKKLLAVLAVISLMGISNIASAATTCNQPLCIVNNTMSDYTLVQYTPPSVQPGCESSVYSSPANIAQGFVLHPGETIQYAYDVSGDCTVKSSFQFASNAPTAQGNWPWFSLTWAITPEVQSDSSVIWWETVGSPTSGFVSVTSYYSKPVSKWSGTYVNGNGGYIVVNVNDIS